jgi:hypothetical protein
LAHETRDDERLASDLKGNTLRVYWALLGSSDGAVGVREVQRTLGFSSPALAAYHLRKLVMMGLADERHGEYHLVRAVKVGVLRHFIRVGSVMLPRYVLYASMFTTLLVFYLTQLRAIELDSVFALLFGGLAAAILWYETLRMWRQRP